MKTCSIEGCNKEYAAQGYCMKHYMRIIVGGSKNFAPGNLKSPGRNIKASLNPRWNGGVSEYPNHSFMKKIRLEVLREADYICWNCGGTADRIHHLDKSKDNHSGENLRASCNKCNMKFRKTEIKPRQSEYKKLFNISVTELQERFRVGL